MFNAITSASPFPEITIILKLKSILSVVLYTYFK